MSKEKIYPSKALEDAWIKNEQRFTVLWEIKGPPNTMVAWMTCYYAPTGELVILQTTKEGGIVILTDFGKVATDHFERLTKVEK